ncbi:hypothetical protein [Nostoc sp.]|uniref:hypothetical protein n=1 Tax=Nostoc sp. TaxID=1180 RepID=UPI002FF4744A
MPNLDVRVDKLGSQGAIWASAESQEVIAPPITNQLAKYDFHLQLQLLVGI